MFILVDWVICYDRYPYRLWPWCRSNYTTLIALYYQQTASMVGFDKRMRPTKQQRSASPVTDRRIRSPAHCKAPTTTLLCSIFLPVLVKAIPCIGKDLGMSTVAYASLMVELEQDGYTSKTRESHLFVGNRAGRFRCLGTNHYLVVLCFPASACQSHPMYR